MQTVKRQTLIAQVTDQLRDEIVSGRWAVGGRIPTEPALCAMTGTARNTVREAVQALVHAGMLERRQGSGTYVISDDEQSLALGEYFADAAERDLLELREALDVTAAVLAAQRRDTGDIADLRRILRYRNMLWRRSEVNTDEERAELISADAKLHRAIVAASHNAVYLEFYDSLLPALQRSMATHPIGACGSHEAEHTELIDAVVAGDPERAAKAARAFITTLRARVDLG